MDTPRRSARLRSRVDEVDSSVTKASSTSTTTQATVSTHLPVTSTVTTAPATIQSTRPPRPATPARRRLSAALATPTPRRVDMDNSTQPAVFESSVSMSTISISLPHTAPPSRPPVIIEESAPFAQSESSVQSSPHSVSSIRSSNLPHTSSATASTVTNEPRRTRPFTHTVSTAFPTGLSSVPHPNESQASSESVEPKSVCTTHTPSESTVHHPVPMAQSSSEATGSKSLSTPTSSNNKSRKSASLSRKATATRIAKSTAGSSKGRQIVTLEDSSREQPPVSQTTATKQKPMVKQDSRVKQKPAVKQKPKTKRDSSVKQEPVFMEEVVKENTTIVEDDVEKDNAENESHPGYVQYSDSNKGQESAPSVQDSGRKDCEVGNNGDARLDEPNVVSVDERHDYNMRTAEYHDDAADGEKDGFENHAIKENGGDDENHTSATTVAEDCDSDDDFDPDPMPTDTAAYPYPAPHYVDEHDEEEEAYVRPSTATFSSAGAHHSSRIRAPMYDLFFQDMKSLPRVPAPHGHGPRSHRRNVHRWQQRQRHPEYIRSHLTAPRRGTGGQFDDGTTNDFVTGEAVRARQKRRQRLPPFAAGRGVTFGDMGGYERMTSVAGRRGGRGGGASRRIPTRRTEWAGGRSTGTGAALRSTSYGENSAMDASRMRKDVSMQDGDAEMTGGFYWLRDERGDANDDGEDDEENEEQSLDEERKRVRDAFVKRVQEGRVWMCRVVDEAMRVQLQLGSEDMRRLEQVAEAVSGVGEAVDELLRVSESLGSTS